jgi:hypothetical protein
MLVEMPEYSNNATKKTEKLCGIFKWDDVEEVYEKELILRGPYELDNGSVYQG